MNLGLAEIRSLLATVRSVVDEHIEEGVPLSPSVDDDTDSLDDFLIKDVMIARLMYRVAGRRTCAVGLSWEV